MLFISLIGMTLPLSVIALAIGAVYSVWLMLNGFPLGWGIAVSIFCLFYMGGAFKLMKFFTGEGGVRNNAAAAACLVPLLEVVLVAYFITSAWPHELSSWWAVLLPLTFVLHLLLQGGFEVLLDAVHPPGRRQ
jgi:hypothetical protein